MDTIRKSIVRDDEERPIAVQIDYADWLKIEKILANGGNTEPRTTDLNSYRGCLTLTEDPLEYQLRVRGEWG
ncbi:MAG TPA: hypothetical protein PLJ47_18940 [Candidatus Hydrogenedentes bacterium]|nr:hypothetical protein [Candidatus Hydrogenedentota bacterium]HRK36682.1 hypothetical protein [Candidatus Hydrogenedentota bacterium]